MHRFAQTAAEGRRDLALIQQVGAAQLIGGADVAGFGQHPGRRLGDILEVDHGESGVQVVGDLEGRLLGDRPPLPEDVLHVRGRLQDRVVEPRLEEQLLQSHLCPVMRHRLDLRVENRVVDDSLDASGERRGDDPAADADLVGMHVGADVVDRRHPVHRCGDRLPASQVALDDLVDAEPLYRAPVTRPAHEGTDRHGFRRQPGDHRQAGLAGRACDQNRLTFSCGRHGVEPGRRCYRIGTGPEASRPCLR